MKIIKSFKTFILFLGVSIMPLSASFFSPTYAAQDNLALGSEVNNKCNFTNSGITLTFGSYDPIITNASTPKDALTTFDLKCTKNQTATLGIDLGLNGAGINRRMTTGSSKFLTYQLYKDASRSSVWGSSGGATVSYTAPNGNATTFTVYGRIPPGQDASIGSYADTVTIIATF